MGEAEHIGEGTIWGGPQIGTNGHGGAQSYDEQRHDKTHNTALQFLPHFCPSLFLSCPSFFCCITKLRPWVLFLILCIINNNHQNYWFCTMELTQLKYFMTSIWYAQLYGGGPSVVYNAELIVVEHKTSGDGNRGTLVQQNRQALFPPRRAIVWRAMPRRVLAEANSAVCRAERIAWRTWQQDADEVVYSLCDVLNDSCWNHGLLSRNPLSA